MNSRPRGPSIYIAVPGHAGAIWPGAAVTYTGENDALTADFDCSLSLTAL